ncbi:MAG: TraX family protein [Proteobacteria bacterium]|nr:TraX family protein [Pseudomonadota bacterium]
MFLVQPCAVLSVPLLALYNGKRGPNAKYLFYIFYPGHLAVLGLIRMFLGR